MQIWHLGLFQKAGLHEKRDGGGGGGYWFFVHYCKVYFKTLSLNIPEDRETYDVHYTCIYECTRWYIS